MLFLFRKTKGIGPYVLFDPLSLSTYFFVGTVDLKNWQKIFSGQEYFDAGAS